MRRATSLARRFADDQRGVAAVEASLIAGVFAIALFNAIEVGRYAYIQMETAQATQAGAHAALVTCDDQHVPATTNCTGLTAAVTTAVQGTSLGTRITLNGAVTEGYYCLNNLNKLVFAGSINAKPSDCSAFGNSALQPALYLQVNTAYTYAPMFPGLTIGQTFPTAVRRTAWMRML